MKLECNSSARLAREYRSRRNSRSSSRPSSSCNSGPDYSPRLARQPKTPLSRCSFSKGNGWPCCSGKRSGQTPGARLLVRLVRAIYGRIWRNRPRSRKVIGLLPSPSQGTLKRRRENLFSLAWPCLCENLPPGKGFSSFRGILSWLVTCHLQQYPFQVFSHVRARYRVENGLRRSADNLGCNAIPGSLCGVERCPRSGPPPWPDSSVRGGRPKP
jgi:hypothetical protein